MKSICYTSLLASSLFLLAGCHSGSPTSANNKPTGNSSSTDSKLDKVGIKDDKVGDGGEFENKRPAARGDTAFMLYTGKLANGTLFDSDTLTDDKKVFNFVIGRGSVIKGWEKGVIGMKIGGVRELSIPASLAYGNQAMGDGKIPANSDLFFTVTLLDLVPPMSDNQITYDDKKIGTGAEVATGNKITVHYTISDLKGNELDSNDYNWTLGDGKAYKQIETGVQGMKVGGVRVIRLANQEALQLTPKPQFPKPSDIQLVKLELKKVG